MACTEGKRGCRPWMQSPLVSHTDASDQAVGELTARTHSPWWWPSKETVLGKLQHLWEISKVQRLHLSADATLESHGWTPGNLRQRLVCLSGTPLIFLEEPELPSGVYPETSWVAYKHDMPNFGYERHTSPWRWHTPQSSWDLGKWKQPHLVAVWRRWWLIISQQTSEVHSHGLPFILAPGLIQTYFLLVLHEMSPGGPWAAREQQHSRHTPRLMCCS